MRRLFLIVFMPILLCANFLIEDEEEFSLDQGEEVVFDTLEIENGKLLAGFASIISIQKDWINHGEFTPSTSTVKFISDQESRVFGVSKFYDFVTLSKEIIFESNQTQEITHRFWIEDSTITSSKEMTQSIINLATVDEIKTNNLDIQDSKIIGRATAINPPNSYDNGNNFMWFQKQSNCQNIGSGHEWFEKLECDNDKKYQLFYEQKPIEFSFDEDIKLTKKIDPDKKIISFEYESTTNECANIKAYIHIDAKGYLTTGFRGCKDDPTLMGWDSFDGQSSAKIIKKEKQDVIVIDLNMTKDLVIGDKL